MVFTSGWVRVVPVSGGSIRKLRKEKRLSQSQLGERIGEKGVTKTTISRWENRDAPEERVEEIADALGVSPEDLLTDDTKQSSIPPQFVQKDRQTGKWRDAVVSAGVDRDVRTILMTLTHPDLLDRRFWVISTTIERFAEITNDPVEWVREHWEEVLESPFVEQVGDGEFCLALRFPDSEE